MAMSEEEQMAAMLAEMGVDESEIFTEENPIPKAPVSRKKEESENKSEESQQLESSNIEVSSNDLNLEQPEITEGLETANDESMQKFEEKNPNLDASRARNFNSHSSSRELTVNSLIHLMGLPTTVQLNVVDTKLDLLTSKLSTIQSKLERIQSQLDLVTTNSPMERIEFQMTEVRTIMKKFFPLAFQNSASSPVLEAVKENKPQVLSNKPKSTESVKNETKIVTNAVESSGLPNLEEEEPLSDEDYQVLEAMKLREKNTESK